MPPHLFCTFGVTGNVQVTRPCDVTMSLIPLMDVWSKHGSSRMMCYTQGAEDFSDMMTGSALPSYHIPPIFDARPRDTHARCCRFTHPHCTQPSGQQYAQHTSRKILPTRWRSIQQLRAAFCCLGQVAENYHRRRTADSRTKAQAYLFPSSRRRKAEQGDCVSW